MPIRYKPLGTSQNEIRLLRTLRSRDNLLHFSLETFPIDAAPPFWAFSYVWGDPKRTSRVVVNNHTFMATENLVFALQTHVREILETRSFTNHPHFHIDHLWVDAICINQNDLQEQSQQVQRMRNIYQKGIVCIYLSAVTRVAYESFYDVTSDNRDEAIEEALSTLPESGWTQIVQFFSEPWFHRMWMIQEFIMADSTPLMLFLGGHKVVRDSKLRDVAWTIFQQNSTHLTAQARSTLFSGIKQYMVLAEVKDRFKHGRACSFLSLLWIFRDRLATDPRDKVYALLGLLRDEGFHNGSDNAAVAPGTRDIATEELIIDYNSVVEDVYASLVKALVTGMGSLNVICACQRPGTMVRSWVPDWSEPWSRVSLLLNLIDIAPEHLQDCRFKASSARTPAVEFSKSLDRINVAGIHSSTVSILRSWSRYRTDIDWVDDRFHNLDERHRLLVAANYGRDLEDAFTPFLLSICATYTKDDGYVDSDALSRNYIFSYPGASAAYKEMVRKYREGDLGENSPDEYTSDIRVSQMVNGRKMFIGDNGYCGLVPDHTEPDDLVCVLFGCDVPVVLRRRRDHYVFIGECYVRGLMQGEAIGAFDRGDASLTHFEIL